MFNFLSVKEKIIMFIFPVLLVLVVIFLGYEASIWRTEAALEKKQKEEWQAQYIGLNDQIKEFNQKQTALLSAIEKLEIANQQAQEEIGNALQNNQTWSYEPVPNDIKRVFNSAPSTN
ncbi:chemotaxis protein [Aggregatibacter actinomycetemcomitans]|uniref:chemotaxis protein n=1 Tax=Aggregatibacter actinomycetemcomitans TaxID=714 RepID=UPI00197C0140|nr:chemotaxis protein [Aggregatibacter actinomycetemcomitans]MBN6079890.1 chemotaxis protein [Aggregatibacter actinomycetemcomitans]